MSGSEEFAAWLRQFPEILAVIVMVVGWVLARVARHGLKLVLPRLNRLSLRWHAEPDSLITPALSKGLEALLFWGILLASLLFAMFLLGGGEMVQLLDGLLGFISRLMVALGILALGHILGLLARSILGGVSGTIELRALPWTAYGLIVGVAAVTSLRHLGLDLTFLTQALLLLITIFFAGLVLAFSLGARTLVSNLVAQNELNRYKPGDKLQVEGLHGTVVEIHRTGVVLSIEQGLASIPAAKFAESTVVIDRSEGDADG